MATWLITGCSTGLGRALAEAVRHQCLRAGLLDQGRPARHASAPQRSDRQHLLDRCPARRARLRLLRGDQGRPRGPRRKENDASHGTQRTDPALGANAMIDAVEADKPPFMLLLGADALAVFHAVTEAERAEVEAWAPVSVSTEFS